MNRTSTSPTDTPAGQYDESLHYPPPWDLAGEGFIFPVFANRDYNLEHGFLSEEDRDAYRGGLGAWMLVNYTTSNVGPYYELLYMPGNFEYQGKRYKRVTKIYVSSQLSVREGIRNWAVPKELADFDWRSDGDRTHVEISTGGKTFFSLDLRKRFFSFPVLSALVPFVMLQKGPDSYIRTPLQGKGKGRVASLANLSVDETYFPDVLKAGGLKTGVGVNPFRLDFPVPTHFR
ncbi:MAG: acetoacetate decarboxylase family protein [bacterium]|nr:acetoacetate decarboxylase family protein [bacterium]